MDTMVDGFKNTSLDAKGSENAQVVAILDYKFRIWLGVYMSILPGILNLISQIIILV
ncbi:MAG: hypothetical protein MJE68_05630 [Proteobacteria bacterium]|nr:hypothetical protein [Pseudomonadota bacterium]